MHYLSSIASVILIVDFLKETTLCALPSLLTIRKKPEMISLAVKYRDVLATHELYATGTTGSLVAKATGLKVFCKKSGPLGATKKLAQ